MLAKKCLLTPEPCVVYLKVNKDNTLSLQVETTVM